MRGGAHAARCAALSFCAASLLGCVRFDVFACSEESDCVLNGLPGSCEASGYCSFPDLDCPTGSRYSQHAPSALAGECVDPGGGGSGSGGDTTSSGSSSGEGESGSTGSDTDGPLGCVDEDGDGAGVGPDCAAEDCDDDNPSTFDGCVYVGPEGDDANPGTRDAPWGTFGHALSQLAPGDSLVVLDGAYRESEAGTLYADCEDGLANSGTREQPIFVRAHNDLRVVIDREGRAYGLGVDQCDHWRFRGISIVSADNAKDDTGAWRAVVEVAGATDIELRHVFGHHTNRFFNEHGIMIAGSTEVLLEDVEIHDFFRSGFSFYASDDVTCRRCYAHSHEVSDLDACPDLPNCADPDSQELRGNTDCPMCSAGSPDRGDNSFYVEHSNDVLLENCVSEGSARGYQLVGGVGLDGGDAGREIRVLQSLSIGDDRGVVMGSNADGVAPVGLVLEDLAVISSTSTGLELRHPDALVVRNVSVLGAGGTAIRVPEADDAVCRSGSCSVTFDRVLVEGAAGSGIALEAEPQEWTIQRSSISGGYDFASADTDDPYDDAGNARDNLEGTATGVGTDAGECLVYVPGHSNMADPFGDGISVGANVVDLLVDGVATGEPLWSAEGAFPCNVDPVEPPQVPSEQCADLSARVGFSMTCEAPPAAG
ncbi:MAG: hypothetical protein ACE37F_23255 [Nannocystaceae bacterium]|nr:hypothetical protein [bacterium]